MHGGKRVNAGRKPTGRNTKVIRIPLELADKIEYIDKCVALEDCIERWKKEAEGKTSPRYYFLNQFLTELNSILQR